jgi:hypothetical protein
MMAAAVTVFIYYTTWAILVVGASSHKPGISHPNSQPSSHSLTHQVRSTRGSPHENGLCAFLPSLWFLVYLLLGVSLGTLLSKKTGSRRRKPSFGLRDVLACIALLLYTIVQATTNPRWHPAHAITFTSPQRIPINQPYTSLSS